MNHNPEHHSVRRIVLPSGSSIEVVRFHDNDEAAPPRPPCLPAMSLRAGPAQSAGPRRADNRWELTIECPNCWWYEEGQYDREQVDRLEENLDDGLADMLGDLQRLTQANMAEEIDRFISALHEDLILPEDF